MRYKEYNMSLALREALRMMDRGSSFTSAIDWASVRFDVCKHCLMSEYDEWRERQRSERLN